LVLNSFLPTLDEIKFADVLMLAFDVSLLEKDKQYFDLQFETILSVLDRFKAFIEKKNFEDFENLNLKKKILVVFNKFDLVKNKERVLNQAEEYIKSLQNRFNIPIFYWTGSAYNKLEVQQLKKILIK
jgi:50S ribosomal subunit-associated GTPase HflX